MPDELTEETTTEVEIKKPAVEEEKEEQTEEKTPEPEALSEATIKATVTGVLKEMMPGLGEAIDQRLKPMVDAVETLKTDMEVIKADDIVKVAAAIDNDGDYFEQLFGNSVQRAEQTGAVKGEKEKGPEESASDFAKMFGNQ